MDPSISTSLVAWIILLPLAGAALTFLSGRRGASVLGFATAGGVNLLAARLAWRVWAYGAQHHRLGGWGAPLGIELYADGLSVLMVLMTAVVGLGISIYAQGYFFSGDPADGNRRAKVFFWPLWLFLWAALNALFLSADIFNLYVTLELLTLAAVALIALAEEREALIAGMRYLLAALLGSLAYLLGVAFLYAAFQTLSIPHLGVAMSPEPPAWVAIVLISVGLLIKTALFPLHFWLPAAHANAPAPVSALLSGIVVKATFYLLLRLWFYVFPDALIPLSGQLVGTLGAAAILWGSLLALRQRRLKLMVAYSTVAQIGYLFVLFPLVTPITGGSIPWSGGIYHALSHATAKAAMFMAAGNVLHALGHDRIADLKGCAQRLPVTLFAFGVAGVSLMGLPPSGGFVAKWLLLRGAIDAGQWWLAVVIVGGGLLAAAYVFPVIRHSLAPASLPHSHPVPRSMEQVALALALVALLLGLFASPPLALLRVGAPFPPETLP